MLVKEHNVEKRPQLGCGVCGLCQSSDMLLFFFLLKLRDWGLWMEFTSCTMLGKNFLVKHAE